MINDSFLFVEKYRPKTVAECILPDRLKDTFQSYVDNNNIQHLTLLGRPGTGKTTIARAMANELEADILELNCSMDGNIDTIRTTLQQFVTTISLINSNTNKICLLDEADYLSHVSQPALRNFIEAHSKNASFILTGNYSHKFIEPLLSRCTPIEFVFTKTELQKMAGQFLKRACEILEAENITFDKKVVAEVIMKYLPDWRRTLSELQKYSVTGTIDSGILSSAGDASITDLVSLMKAKNYTGVRKWVGENSDIDTAVLYRKFYDQARDLFEPQSIPMLVILIAKYQDYATRAIDNEINNSAFLAEVMVEAIFK